MMVGDRIKKLRQQLQMTQTDLASKVGLSYIQIGRYEKHKSKPSAAVLQKLANALNTSADYLMNGDSQEIASAKITDRGLLELFQAVDVMDEADKEMVKTFLDALVTKRKVQSLAS